MKPVCKLMFLNTFMLKEWCVRQWVKSSTNGIHVAPTQNVTKRNVQNSVKRDFVRSHLEALPKLPSHYCRASSSKMYLEQTFHSYADVYSSYCDKESQEDREPVSRMIFMEEFNKMNLEIFIPKKDQCDLCCSYEEGNLADEEYQIHVSRKEESRKEKASDKEIAIKSNGEIVLLTVDVQAVLIAPFLKASALYYKTKLACHNYTVYNMVTKQPVCYLWHEGEGEMSSSMFASCLLDYFKSEEVPQKVKEIIIYSDGCAAQNRNVVLSNALLHFAITSGITVTQKYLERGHTQMECDSVHSVIERKRKNCKISVPAQYADIIENARSRDQIPYKVKYVDHTFFKYYSRIKYYNSLRPGKKTGDPCVNDLRCIKYSQTEQITFKLHYSDAWSTLPQRTKSGFTDSDVKQLYNARLCITKQKYEDLQSLKPVLKSDYHAFYDNLPYK